MTSRTEEDAFATSILSPSSVHPTQQQFRLSSPPSSSSSSSRQPHIPGTSVNAFDATINRRLRNGLKCPTCSKVFSNSSAIAKHKLTHSDERKHVCHVCKKAFKRQDHLNGHKLTHASKKPHGCRICEKSYSDARSLRRHYENAHRDEYELWRAAEEAETQLSAVVVAAAAAASGSVSGSAVVGGGGGGSNDNNLAQQLVAAKVTNGRTSPWLSSAAGSVNSATSGGEAGGGGGSNSGRVSPVIPEQLKAVLMALPLEAPRVVPCAFCHRRFKNQSALNGHMRLHGGYGLNHVTPGASTSSSSACGSDTKTPTQLQRTSTPPRLYLPGSSTMSRLKKNQSQSQQLPLGLGSQSINEPFRLLRDLPDTKSEGSSSLFDWPCGPVSTLPAITTEALGVSSSAASITTSRSMRPWPAHSGQHSQQQASSNIYNAVRQGLPRPHSELHFNETTVGHSPYRGGASFRKRPSPSIQQNHFRSTPQDSMWFSPQHHSSHQPSLRTHRSDPMSSVDPIFNNLRLFDTIPNSAAFVDQGSRYISRLAPPPPPSHTSHQSGDGDYSGSKLESLAMFGDTSSSEQHHQQSGFFQSGSYPNLHGIGGGGAGTVDRPVAQPHYSPITPASGGLAGNSNSASSAFTFPPTDALLALTPTSSPPPISHQGVRQHHHQQQQFLCPCPPSRSNNFEDSNKWLSHEQHSIEPMLSSPPIGRFSSPPPPPPPTQQPMNPTPSYQQQHEGIKHQPPRLYTPVQTQQQQQPRETVEDASGGSDFYHQQQLHSMYDHRPKPICSNTWYDSSPMRHPMTPQHTTNGIQPRAYSYSTTSTQAAYSVPLMPNRERIFFPDDSDPLLLADENPCPISTLLPPPQLPMQQTQPMSNEIPQQQQELQMQPSQFFELSCVPTHKYAQHGGSKKEDEERTVEETFRNPPPLTRQLTPTESKSSSSQIHLPSPSSVTAAQSSISPPGIVGETLKKVKKKPEPIVIPSFTHRINPSRLRSPRLSTASSVGVANAELNSLLSHKGGQSVSGGLSLSGILESLPYTPPPMLSPNRRGSGLFSSMIARSRRPPRTATTATAASAANLLRLRTGRGSIPSDLTRVEGSGPMLTASGINSMGSIPTGANSALTNVNSSSMCRQMENNFFALTEQSGVAPGGSPKSAPAFMKNVAYFSSETSLNSVCVGCDDIAPPTIAMRTTLGGDEAKCPRPPSKPLFFADEDDLLETTAAAAAVEDSHQISEATIPDSSEAGALHEDELAATISDLNTSTFPPIPHDIDTPSSSSCHCCSEDSPALPQVEEMDYEEEEEELDDCIVEDMGVPSNFEPKINIGAAYQVAVPGFAEGHVMDLYREENRCYESLLWDPRNIDDTDPKTEESLSNLMNLARSPVVRNCGLNMEYTFHLLCKFQGDFEMTLRALLHESFTIFDRVYSETEYWTTEEIEKFQNSLRRPYKDFHHVSAELRACGMNKSVKACVEFYYVWKRMNTPHEVNRYRGRVHRKSLPTRSDRPPIEGNPSHTHHTNDLCGLPNLDNNSLDLDMPPTPDLGVDDNNSSSTSYNLRRKHHDLPPTINREYDDHELKSSWASNESSAIATVVGGMEGGFPCHLCGRYFAKVKSMNVHMKSHAASAHSKQPDQ